MYLAPNTCVVTRVVTRSPPPLSSPQASFLRALRVLRAQKLLRLLRVIRIPALTKGASVRHGARGGEGEPACLAPGGPVVRFTPEPPRSPAVRRGGTGVGGGKACLLCSGGGGGGRGQGRLPGLGEACL